MVDESTSFSGRIQLSSVPEAICTDHCNHYAGAASRTAFLSHACFYAFCVTKCWGQKFEIQHKSTIGEKLQRNQVWWSRLNRIPLYMQWWKLKLSRRTGWPFIPLGGPIGFLHSFCSLSHGWCTDVRWEDDPQPYQLLDFHLPKLGHSDAFVASTQSGWPPN